MNTEAKWCYVFFIKLILFQKTVINTIPELMKCTELLTWLFPFSPFCPELQSACHNYCSAGTEQGRRLTRDAAKLEVVLSIGLSPALSNWTTSYGGLLDWLTVS